jgi:hypothetical protein
LAPPNTRKKKKRGCVFSDENASQKNQFSSSMENCFVSQKGSASRIKATSFSNTKTTRSSLAIEIFYLQLFFFSSSSSFPELQPVRLVQYSQRERKVVESKQNSSIGSSKDNSRRQFSPLIKQRRKRIPSCVFLLLLFPHLGIARAKAAMKTY